MHPVCFLFSRDAALKRDLSNSDGSWYRPREAGYQFGANLVIKGSNTEDAITQTRQGKFVIITLSTLSRGVRLIKNGGSSESG